METVGFVIVGVDVAINGTVSARREEWDGDGKFGAEEECEVQEACPRGGGVAGREAAEAVVELAAVACLADARRNEHPPVGNVLSVRIANSEFADSRDVGLASRDQIWARSSKEVLQRLG